MNEMYYWLSAALLCILLEMGHPGLFMFLSFAWGALAGAAAAYMGYGIMVQVISALCCSVVSFGILSWWLRHKGWLDSHKGHHTNVYALIGKDGIVTKRIEPSKVGKVKIGGETWSARSVRELSIQEGARIQVLGVSGVHVIVQEKEL